MDFARYIGVPFVPLGRDMTGCDCWGLVRLFYQNELNIELPSYVYDESFNPEELNELAEKEKAAWAKVPLGEEKVGDVILLRLLNPHVGIVLKRGTMVHIEKGIDSCVEKYNSSLWKKRIRGIYRYGK